MAAFERVWPVMLGITVALAALTLAVLAVGPILRSVVGLPAGFGTDVTSRGAYLQAVCAQVLSLAICFLVMGLIFQPGAKRDRWQWAFCAANPLTLGLAYWVFRRLGSDDWPYEYKALHGWLVITVIAPVIFAPCVYLGSRLIRK